MTDTPDTPDTTPGEMLQRALDEQTTDSEVIASMVDSMRHAVTTVRGGAEVPDYRVRLQAALAILSYRHGRPVERQESISVVLNADKDKDAVKRLKHSPSLRETMKAALAEAEAIEA